MSEKLCKLWRSAREASNNELLNKRYSKIIMPMATVLVILLIPFAFMNLFAGNLLMTGTIVFTTTILAENAVSRYLKKLPFLPLQISFLSICFAINLAIYDNRIDSVFWAFPTAVVVPFFYSRKIANFFNVILYCSSSLMVYLMTTFSVTIRFTVTLAIIVVAVNFILKIQDELHAKLLEDTIRDPLTDAFNRRLLDVRLGEAIERKKRMGISSSIVLFDLDFFKRINDTVGHAGGDEILVKISHLVGKTTRKYDYLFRLGGEEFLILLPDTGEDGAYILSQKLQAALSFEDFKIGLPVTVTIGVSEVQYDDTVLSWIKSADDALYEGKRTGRNCIVRRKHFEITQGAVVCV